MATAASSTSASSAHGGPLNPVTNLHEEAVCAICLDYFIDPVSIGCGHNFCRVCITQLWGSGEGQGEEEEGDDGEASGSDGGYGPGSEGGIDDGDLGPEEDADDEEDDLEDEYLDDGDMEEEREDLSRDEYDGDDAEDVWDDEEDRDYWDQDPGSDEMWDDAMGGDIFFNSYDEEDDIMDEDEEPEEDTEYTVPATPPMPPLRQAFTCPQCRKTFPRRSFRPNLQLANMVEIIRRMHPQPYKPATPSTEEVELAAAGDSSGAPSALAAGKAQSVERSICEKHQEPLKLFCETDEEPICVVCRESRAHKHHSVMPLEEVVQEYKAELQGHLDPLKKKLESVLKQKAKEEAKIADLKNKMKLDMKEFESDFERLHQFLVGEQALLLHQLEDRYDILLARQSSNVTHLEEQEAALSRLIAEAEDKSKQDGLQLLKDFKGTLVRCENIKFHDPEMVAVDAGKKYQNYFLIDVLMKKMEKVFSKAPRVDLTLDPDTAHPRLTLSSDSRGVRLGERWRDVPDSPKRFDSDYCVLALQGFTCGRHYWEVEVGGRRGWAVGAARESARRKEKASTASPYQKREIWCVGTNGKKYQALSTTEQMPLSPCERLRRFCVYLDYERGQLGEIWCVGTNGKKYQALSTTEQMPLSPCERLRRFCVYLDYERGQLGFYNAENMAHIHTFNASFRERIFPFFRILSKGTRIKICN
nr:E3 ubiquitin-protein ligase TRIM41-like [Anolis sagrei ordinatus]